MRSLSQSCPTLCDPMDCSLSGSLRPWYFPGKSAGVDCLFLLQGIFPTQESNSGVPHCRQTLYRLSHQGSPKINGTDLTRSRVSWGTIAVWNSPGQNTGVGSLSLPQGIFPTQGSNPGSPHCRRILYQLSHKGSP